jgi:hypothetical protein
MFPLTVTGGGDLFEAARDVAEPVTRSFERLPLGPFSLDETRQAIQGPLEAVGHPSRVREDAVRLVWERSGGHPYFVAFTMREAVHAAGQRGVVDLTADLLLEAWPAITRQLAIEKFSVEWNTATPAERSVLRAAVTGGSLTQAAGRRGPSLAARLVKKGLLVRRGRGSYAADHPLFAEYVRRMPG